MSGSPEEYTSIMWGLGEAPSTCISLLWLEGKADGHYTSHTQAVDIGSLSLPWPQLGGEVGLGSDFTSSHLSSALVGGGT